MEFLLFPNITILKIIAEVISRIEPKPFKHSKSGMCTKGYGAPTTKSTCQTLAAR
jgi:hypothetical protein